MINVTQPFMPPLEEFNEYLEKIWENKWLTNNGPFHEEFEQQLCEYLDVPYVSLFANGTLALITALQALNIEDEVITTPYSFVATSHALWWNRIKPVFTDIEPEFCTLDPQKLEAAITPHTTAILPVHVYGYPCRVEKIQQIADRHGLKVIYDAAHSMGAKYKGKSLASYGDLSILSFHATKLFHTIEGGAIICHDKKLKQKIDYLKNFGFEDETTVVMPGINAKMNELQAAMGLVNFKYLEEIIALRKKLYEVYYAELSGLSFLKIPIPSEKHTHNYAYVPVFFECDNSPSIRDVIYAKLKENDIYARRYFYPLISSFSPYNQLNSAQEKNLLIATDRTNRVLCLPIYPNLEENEIIKICKIIKDEFVL